MTDNVGSRLRALRTAVGWTQLDLARRMNQEHGYNWVQSTVQKNEAGARPLTLAEAQALSEVFGVSLDELVHGPHEGERYPPYDPMAVRVDAYTATLQALRWERNAMAVRINEIDDLIRQVQQELADMFGIEED